MLSAVFDIPSLPPAPRPSGNAHAGREDAGFSELVPEVEAAGPAPATSPEAELAAAPASAETPVLPATPTTDAPVADALAALLAAAGVIVPAETSEDAKPATETTGDDAGTDADAVPDAQTMTQAGAIVSAEMPVAVAVPPAPIATDAPQKTDGEGEIAIAADATPALAAAPDILAQSEATPDAAPQPDGVEMPAPKTADAKAAMPEVKAEAKIDITSASTSRNVAEPVTSTEAPQTDAAPDLSIAPKGDAKATAEIESKPDAKTETKAEPRHDKPAERTPAAQAAPVATQATQGTLPHGDAASIVQLTPAATHASPHVLTQNAPTDAQSAPQIATVPVAAVPMEIAAAAREGKTRFEIRLDPPELGRIDVRLDVDRNGNVTSRLTVERVETLDLLRRDAPQLDRALQDAGLKTGDSALQFSLRQQDQSPRDQQQQQQNRAQYALTDDTVQLPETAARLYGRGSGAGGIDIRV